MKGDLNWIWGEDRTGEVHWDGNDRPKRMEGAVASVQRSSGWFAGLVEAEDWSRPGIAQAQCGEAQPLDCFQLQAGYLDMTRAGEH